jgi:hypothetical protein
VIALQINKSFSTIYALCAYEGNGPNRTLTKVRDAAVQLSQSGRWRILQHFLDQNIGQTCRSPFHFLI